MAQSQDSISLLNTSSLSNIAGARVAVIYTEWNDKITAEQLAGAERILQQHNLNPSHKIVVPGCFELPFACKQLWDVTHQDEATAPEAIIAFGAVIRGGTPHFDYVCQAATDGITKLNLELPIPTIFGVLTLDNETQAWERLGGTHGHKGEEAAITALKMINNSRALKQ